MPPLIDMSGSGRYCAFSHMVGAEAKMASYDVEQLTGEGKGTLVRGANDRRTGVVVLSGSSGRIDTDRATLFAEAGTSALALQWFGGEISLQEYVK